jgi:hypothetical protein
VITGAVSYIISPVDVDVLKRDFLIDVSHHKNELSKYFQKEEKQRKTGGNVRCYVEP